MGKGAGVTRSARTHEVPRRPVYLSGPEFKELSALQVASRKVDELFAANR